MSSPLLATTKRTLTHSTRPYRLAAGGALVGLALATGLALHLGTTFRTSSAPIAAAQVAPMDTAELVLPLELHRLQEQLRATATQDTPPLTAQQAHQAVAQAVARQDALRLLKEQLRATAIQDMPQVTSRYLRWRQPACLMRAIEGCEPSS